MPILANYLHFCLILVKHIHLVPPDPHHGHPAGPPGSLSAERIPTSTGTAFADPDGSVRNGGRGHRRHGIRSAEGDLRVEGIGIQGRSGEPRDRVVLPGERPGDRISRVRERRHDPHGGDPVIQGPRREDARLRLEPERHQLGPPLRELLHEPRRRVRDLRLRPRLQGNRPLRRPHHRRCGHDDQHRRQVRRQPQGARRGKGRTIVSATTPPPSRPPRRTVRRRDPSPWKPAGGPRRVPT